MTLSFPRLSCVVHLFFAPLACKCSSRIVYVDLIFVTLTTWPQPCNITLVVACNIIMIHDRSGASEFLAPSTALCKSAAQSFMRFRIPLTPSMLHRALLILTPWFCHFRDLFIRSFLFFACLARKWSPSCIVHVDLIFVALTTWP